jgi:small subunit ribosomal protein S4
MAKYNGPKNRLSRREGVDLFGKGNKLRRATVPPGQHGPKGAKRLTGFGQRLREKQKLRRMYGIMERQFRKYFEKAARAKGNTGDHLLQLLEIRLDNVIYRLGFVPTRAMARQVVGHGHVLVNGKKVNIPSYQVNPGEEIKLSEKLVSPAKEETVLPSWLDRSGPVGKVLAMPKRDMINVDVTEQLVVEFYSK